MVVFLFREGGMAHEEKMAEENSFQRLIVPQPVVRHDPKRRELAAMTGSRWNFARGCGRRCKSGRVQEHLEDLSADLSLGFPILAPSTRSSSHVKDVIGSGWLQRS